MKMIKRTLVLTLILLICISIASGLKLSASTGGSGSSSNDVTFGATVDDYAYQHIGLSPGDATLASATSGSGSLPGASISKTDSKGNYVYVYRSVSGKPGVTTWNFDWRTYTPYSSTAGYGLGAELWLTASKAYSITGKGKSSNAEGDSAEAFMTVGSSYPYTTSYLSNYYVNPYAFTNEVGVYQKADSASSTGPITITGISNNRESDYTKTTISATKGTISNPTTNVYSSKTSTYSYPTASLVDTAGKGTLYAYASNKQGDSSKFTATVSNGKIFNPNFYAWSGTRFAETKGSVSNLYGSVAEINTQALSKILGYQRYNSLGVYSKKAVSKAEGDFAAKKTNNAQFGSVSVTTRATNGYSDRTDNDITISTTGFGANTALILDPRREEFVKWHGGPEIRDSVMNSLKNKGYAVSYFSDSAVTKEKVKQMDEYKVSVVNTHSSPTGIDLSKSSDGVYWDQMSASELKSAYTNYNGMAIVDGCSSFASTGSGTWADAMNKANVRGGTTESWSTVYTRSFINRYFTYMGQGYSAYQANEKAKGSDVIFDSNGNPTGVYKIKKLSLLGNLNFVL